MRSRIWQLHLAAGLVASALYALVPPFAGSSLVMNLLGLSPAVAIVAGLRLHRPASARPWAWFAIGFAFFWLGDLYTYGYPQLTGEEVGIPSLGDASYIAVYPALMAGLLILVRCRTPVADRAGAVDSLIVTLGLTVISWVALIAPYLEDDELGIAAKLVSVAYPLGDVLLLAAAVRLAMDTGRREPAFHLMATAIVALLVTDFAYGLATLHGTYAGQLSLDLGWIAFYLLWGTAALHPSMAGLEQAGGNHEAKLTPGRLALLTAASLIAPAVALAQELRRGELDLLVVIAASVVLFLLVVTRMAGLVRQHEHAVARERILSAAGAELVAATRREDLHGATVGAAVALAGPGAAAVLCRVEDGQVAALGRDAPRVLPEAAGAALLAGSRDASPAPLPEGVRAALGAPETHGWSVVLGLSVRGETRGLLVASHDARPDAVAVGALQALAAQVSLALESLDLTEEVHRRTSEARFGSLVQHSSDLITVLDRSGRIAYQSPSIERVLGHTAEEVTGRRLDTLLASADAARLLRLLERDDASPGVTETIECSLRHRDGSTRQFEVLCTDLLNDQHVQGIVLNGRDVSERRAFEEQLSHQAFHDPVTNLANRALFAERTRHAVARAVREGGALAVLFLDLDDFKTINDSLGHAAGDEVLVEVARRLSDNIRATDTAARFGGDEFAVLLEEVGGGQEAADAAERILEAFAAPLQVAHKELFVHASLGISVAEDAGALDADELLRNADAAMYIAKRDGKGGYRLFEPAMHEGVLERLELRADLQRALATDQLELHYQPVVRLEDGSVSGFEALLRWRHPERGLVAPGDFIPLAEETGLIVPIGRWVLREGCRQARTMQAHLPGDRPLSIAVNLSVKQLQHSDVVGDVRDALESSGLPPSSLTLEITESVMMTDADLAIARLEELKALGVRLAMDDFGTGYSSLSHLSRLPVDVLKMDRSFLREGATAEGSGLATAVVALGGTLGLDVVAEGIELPEQWDGLRELGCDLGQGSLFARPMDAEQTREFLRAAEPAASATPTGAD